MHVQTCKLANIFPGCTHVPRFNRGGSKNGEMAGVKRSRGEGKEKVEGMTERRGRKEDIANSEIRMGELHHCS